MNCLRSAFRFRSSLVLLCALMAVTGCSGFHRDWKRAADLPAAAGGIEGRWEGSWVSDENGHHGRLRCLLSVDEDGQHQARFHAKYKGILSFGYAVPLQVTNEGGVFRFIGEADLGALAGGIYTYEGNASPTNFFSTYKSRYDMGTFQMTRP